MTTYEAVPTLRHVADVEVKVGTPISVGETSEGLRRVVPILGGRIEGPDLRGEILAAGADYQTIRADGYSKLDARYVAKLDDGALIYICNLGVRFGPPEVMARITRGEPVDPAHVYFRTAPSFETASPAHQWLVQPLFVASGVREPDCVRLKVFQVV